MSSAAKNNKKDTDKKAGNGTAAANQVDKLDDPAIKSANLFPVVGIGASAGGLDAFKRLLKAIPEDSGMAYVLVQHLDPKHESMLPEILQKITPIPVMEITDDIKVQPDHIYVIPSNKMMVATDGVLLLAPRPAKSTTGRNLPIDLFFKSLAEVHLEHAIGVVLSGTASDGTQGLKYIKEHGGITFAQDEESAEYEGMPSSAINAGVVDFVLPPEEIPKKILEVINKTILSDEELQNFPRQDEDVFKQILSLLRIRKGVDFTYYKQTTIRRRILRRMVVNKNEEPGDYLKFLRGNNPEQDLLYQDMLIPVTSFFRDKKVFQNLCVNVFPSIIKNKIPGELTRVWVAGCSTGQEVYSFAMCFKEFLGDAHERIQIFGSDLSEPAITKARTGMYEKSELDAISPERLKEYFTKSNGGYQVIKSIRDMCVFAHHNFLKDPPFGKMDVITCRNVLIYMEPYLQKKALTTFHYALKPGGFLLLGKSETTGGVPDLFTAVEKTDKLYTRKDVPGRFMQVASQRSEQILNSAVEYSKSETIRTDFQKTADDILLSKYTPGGVVVNEAMDIVHFRGNTANYLEQAPGKPSHNLLVMAKSGLGFELRNILHKAKSENVPVVKDKIPLSINGIMRNIAIEALPLPNTLEPYYLVLFHDNNVSDTDGSVISNRKKVSAKTKKEEKDIQIQLLEHELAQAREDMRTITEDQEASNEELQSANEELLSGSEELQSLNEELETSKEELQSTNEELTVLNNELISLNEQVTDARNYSESIVATLYQPLLVLDKNLRVKTANQAFYKTFQVNEQETEGVLIYDLGNRQWNIPALRNLLEEILPQKKQISNFEVTHNFQSIGERVILLSALELTREKKEEKLILLSIEDITEEKKAEIKLRASEHRFRNLVEQATYPICILKGKDMVIDVANDAMLSVWKVGKECFGKSLWNINPETKEQVFAKLLLDVLNNGITHHGKEEPAYFNRADGTRETIYFNFVYQPFQEDDGNITGVMVLATDVSEQVLARKKIEESEFRYHNMIYSSPSLIAIFKGEDMIIEIANDAVLQSWGKGKDIIGKSLYFVMPEIVEQGFGDLLLSVFKTGEPLYAYEMPVTLIKNGKPELMHYTFNYQAQQNADGVIEGVAVIANEVSAQVELNKKLKESETFNRSILENSPDCVKLIDIEGRIQFMNVNGLCILEIDDFKGIKNKLWTELWGVETIPVVLDAIEKALQGKTVQFQAFGPTAKGTPKWWDVMVSPVVQPGTNEVTNIISVSRDITSQREFQSLLEYRKALLEAHNEASFDGILLVDAQGKILSYNHKFIEIWNMPQHIVDAKDDEAALAFAMTQLVHPEQFIEKVKYLYENPTETSTDILEFKDGKIVERHGYPVVADGGLHYAWSWTFRDVTEGKTAEIKLRKSEEHFRQLANLIPDKINTTDTLGQVNYYNQNWVDFSGFSFSELIAKGWEPFIHPDDLPGVSEKWQHALATGNDAELELRLMDKNGVYTWHLTRASAVKDEEGKVIKWIGCMTEIQKIKEEEERKDDFLKMVSHELKTPVTSVKGYVQLLLHILKEQQATPSAFLETPLLRIDNQVGRLGRLISEMLDLSRLNTGKLEMEKETFNLEELISETVQDISFTNNSHAIYFAGDQTANVFGDRNRIGQVIINLVNNAVKYSPENEQIEITMTPSGKDNIAVSIIDHGIGIEKQHQQKIFERFYRAGGESEKNYAGFGIGLFIAAEIIEKHGGNITVESEKDKGSSFTFTLPLASATQPVNI